MRGNGQRAVFDEAAGIDQISDVLPGSATTFVVPLGDRGGSALVPSKQMAVGHFVEVCARTIEFDCGSGGLAVSPDTGAGEDQ